MRRWKVSALSLAGGVALLLVAGGFRDRVMASDAQPGVASIACVDPKATFVLGDPDMMARHTARWRASVGRRGRCFTIEPGEHWERVLAAGGLVLMRKVPPEPGVPPLYFRADQLVSGTGIASGAERAGNGADGAVPGAVPGATGSAEAARSGGLGRLGRVAARAGRAVTEILTETLPPLPTAELPDPAAMASKEPVLGAPPDVNPVPFGPISMSPAPAAQEPAPSVQGPVSETPLAPPAHTSVASAAPAPAAPESPAPVQALAPAPAPGPVPQQPATQPGPDQADLSVASARGYAFGFAITITLLVLLLAAFVLVLWMLLRRPPEPERGPSVDDARLREPMQRPGAPFVRPAGRLGAGSDQGRPGQSRPGSRQPVVAGPFAGVSSRVEPVMQGADLVAAAPAPAPALASALAAGPEAERCAARLREAGWEADVRTGSAGRLADVVARRDGRVMALRCLTSASPVGEEDVEEACVVRERERADLAVIVSGAAFTPGARQLAGRTGVELLPDDGLRAYLAG